jgi:hypothetical protein
MSDRISNGKVIPYHLAYCCGIPRISLVFLFFTSLLLHHSMDLRLAHARHFRYVSFHLVAITLLSRWRQRRPTRRLRIPCSSILDLCHLPGTRRNIRRPGICHASCRSVDALETSVPPATCLLRHQTHIRIGIGFGIRNAVQIPPVEAFGVSFSEQLLQDRAVWNL